MLPKYYVIKRDNNNPLWLDYIKWINTKSDKYLNGKTYQYYGYDGNTSYPYYNGFNCEDQLHRFCNEPEVITLEEWNNSIDREEININKTHNNINNVPIENKGYICIVAGGQVPTIVHKNIEEASTEAMRLCSKENRKVSIATIVKVYKPKIIAEEQI